MGEHIVEHINEHMESARLEAAAAVILRLEGMSDSSGAPGSAAMMKQSEEEMIEEEDEAPHWIHQDREHLQPRLGRK